jgi:hypothetical protein
MANAKNLHPSSGFSNTKAFTADPDIFTSFDIGPGFYFASDFFFSEAKKSYYFIFRQEDKPDFFSTNFAYNNSLKMTN